MRSTGLATTGQKLTESFELYALAGHFVGEGSIGWYNTPTIQVKSCVERELFLYPRFFGGEIKRHESKKDNHRAFFVWRRFGQNAVDFCLGMMPFLWADKWTQAELLVQGWAMDKGEERDRVIAEIKAWKRVEG